MGALHREGKQQGMTYEEAREYLKTAEERGMKPGLDRMKELLFRLGDPERSLRFVHIAGTNGKGSVCAFLTSILTECGYRIGTYTSPAVFSYEERFQINGIPMEKSRLCSYVEQIKEAAECIERDGLDVPTVFEMETAAAFLYFQEENCDLVVLEAGLGGRDDATNVVENTVISVITSVGLDHRAVLGKTPEEIAAAKAGIIKQEIPVVYNIQDLKARAVVEQVGEGKRCLLRPVQRERLILSHQLKPLENGRVAQMFTYKYYTDLEISMLGRYQAENGATAVETAETLSDWGFSVSQEQIRTGLLRAVWPGRFEWIRENPLVFLDGAHNPEGIRALLESLRFYFPDRNWIGVTAVLADKDYEEMARIFGSEFRKIYTVPSQNKRALDATAYKECISRYQKNAEAADSVEDGVKRALREGKSTDVIVIFGSLSFLKEAKEAVEKERR